MYHRGTLAAYRFRHTRDDDLNFPDVQFPHGWVPGIVKLHIHWGPGANGAALIGKAVRWVAVYDFASINGVFGGESTHPFEDTIVGQNYKHQMTAEFDIDLSGYLPSALGMLRVYRDNAVANNVGAGMFLFSVDFHIQMQGLGTVNSNGSGGR
jgi:hypothetical protein